MSRWADAFNAMRARDTVDTVDTVNPRTGAGPDNVNGVNSVMGGKRTYEASRQTALNKPDAPADNLSSPASTSPPVIPVAEQVEAMAQAMMSNPVYRITDPEKAIEYFRANALTRLCATADPPTRRLLLDWERRQGVMAMHSRPTGR